MDYYFLQITIEEFDYNPNEFAINTTYHSQKTNNISSNKDLIYEVDFELKESREKYTLKIINESNIKKIPSTKNIILPTQFSINNKNTKNDFLNISLYIKNLKNSENIEKRKLIDIDKGKLIDINCIKNKKYYSLKLGNFSIKFSYELNNNKINNDIYHKINSNDFFDVNVDIFEEEEKEEDDSDKSEKNPFELAQEINPKKIYRNTHMSLYQKINLEQPILKEIIKDNLIECFLITGLSQSKLKIKNSEKYKPQCVHKKCEKYGSYISQIFFRLQKPNSIFDKIESNLISNLIFPNGIKICYGNNYYFSNIIKNRNFSQSKNANYTYNVLTDINGNRYYIYSMIFFIKFEFNDFIEIYKDYNNDENIEEINTKLNNDIFISFSFSIISKIFDYEKFNLILKDLYITFTSNVLKPDLFDEELISIFSKLYLSNINII